MRRLKLKQTSRGNIILAELLTFYLYTKVKGLSKEKANSFLFTLLMSDQSKTYFYKKKMKKKTMFVSNLNEEKQKKNVCVIVEKENNVIVSLF